jgi:tripartite-type tricarboxylate transporter receptor subunit TctC
VKKVGWSCSFSFKNHFKVLVLTGEQRNLALPDVPKAKEWGYSN